MWHLKYDTNQHIYETETDSQTCGSQGGWKGRIGSLGLADANYFM